MPSPVPQRFRSLLGDAIDRLAAHDFVGLTRHGYVRPDNDIGHWIEEYPATLVPVPAEGWDLSECGRVVTRPGAWWVVVPLWTAEEGRRDLSLEPTIQESDGDIALEIDNVHVL
jgi:hypothetical protein